MTDNLRIWKALEKTDPNHTKGFSRSGGFKGTAIKPIYNIRRMTEQFGPCGEGWGMTEPAFNVVEAAGETLVFCTAALWHGARDNLIYGVGGDKVSAKRGDGSFNSDEAFKAAYTDAISNAMKMLGVGADVHMGLFDDHKYVAELKREFDEDQFDAAGYIEASSRWIKAQTDIPTINQAWTSELDNLAKLSPADQQKLIAVRDGALTKLSAKPEGDDWKLKAEEIKADIDNALDTVAVRDILEGKAFADIVKNCAAPAVKFLRDRAERKIGTLMQGRKAA